MYYLKTISKCDSRYLTAKLSLAVTPFLMGRVWLTNLSSTHTIMDGSRKPGHTTVDIMSGVKFEFI